MPGTTIRLRRGEDVTEFRGFLAQVGEFAFLKLLLVAIGPDVVIRRFVFE